MINKKHIRFAPYDGILYCALDTIYTSLTQLLTDVTQLNEISIVSAIGLEPNLKDFRPRVRNIIY